MIPFLLNELKLNIIYSKNGCYVNTKELKEEKIIKNEINVDDLYEELKQKYGLNTDLIFPCSEKKEYLSREEYTVLLEEYQWLLDQ